MLRSAFRPFSSDFFSKASSIFRYSTESIPMPLPEYATMPKVGLFNGGYEVFHDFAIDCINLLQSNGLGMGSSLIILSLAMRATFSPFILMSQVNALKNILLYPEMDKYREDMSLAYRSGNKAKIEAVNNYFKELKFKYKINNSYSIFTMAQVPFIIYFFWTLQDMTYNVDIYPAMTTDGFLWFKDLSEADPYFALPVMFACSTFWAIHKSPNSAQSIGPMSKYLKYLKYFVFLGIPVTSTFPAAIVLNWTMMSVFQMTINSLVYSRIGRKILKIPQYLPGSILEKHNTRVTSPVLKPKVFSHKPSLPKK